MSNCSLFKELDLSYIDSNENLNYLINNQHEFNCSYINLFVQCGIIVSFSSIKDQPSLFKQGVEASEFIYHSSSPEEDCTVCIAGPSKTTTACLKLSSLWPIVCGAHRRCLHYRSSQWALHSHLGCHSCHHQTLRIFRRHLLLLD